LRKIGGVVLVFATPELVDSSSKLQGRFVLDPLSIYIPKSAMIGISSVCQHFTQQLFALNLLVTTISLALACTISDISAAGVSA
jgi:hypothetical protein